MRFTDTRQFMEKINQYYHLVIAGPLLFFIYLFFTRSKQGWPGLSVNESLNSGILFVLLPVVISGCIWAFRNYRFHVKRIPKNLPLPDRLDEFAGHFITLQLFIGLGGLLSLIGLYITGKQLFFGLYIILLFVVSFHRPSVHFIIKALGLKDTEKETVLKQLPF